MALSLNFRVYGEGPPLVILHGLFGSLQNWHSMAERLSADYRVFACDLRNHGDSPWAPTMDFTEMADDLEALLEEHGLSPATILGHSVGGKTAMLTALRHPDLVETLVVVDIAPVRYEERFLDYVRTMQAVDLTGITRRSEVDAALQSVVEDAGTRAFLLQNLEERRDGFAWRLNLEAIGDGIPVLLDFPNVEDVEYESRALFVSGEHSDYIGRVHHHRIYDLFPQAEFGVIAGAGHYPHVEQPDAFAARLTDFLESAYA